MSGKWEKPNVPHKGWSCIDIKDLGKPIMTCQMCEKETIRYAHYMGHSGYQGVLIVGCICAGKMEGDLQNAKKRDTFMKSRMNKRKNWLARKWKISQKGNQYIKSDGFIVVMKQKKNGVWFAFLQSEDGVFKKWSSQKNANENEMKLAAFDCLTNVLAEREMPQEMVKTELVKETNVKMITESVLVPTIKPEKNFMQGELFQILVPVENKQVEKPPGSEPLKLEANNLSVKDDAGCQDNAPESVSSLERNALSEICFTAEQERIFEFIKNGTGHGIIDAVAGAGKTTTIMECAKYVENKTDVLFCAFNKSIQSEIAAKFNRQALNQITVKTIHALGFQILNDNNNSSKKIVPKESKYWTILNKEPSIHEEMQVFIEKLLHINDYKSSEYGSHKDFATKNMIHKFKERLLDMNQKIRATLTPNEFEKFKELAEHFGFFSEMMIKSKHYQKELEIYFEASNVLLEAGNALAREALIIDYTDMLYLPFVWNLRASRTYSFLFIDECQDLSKSQLAVVLKYGMAESWRLGIRTKVSMVLPVPT